MAEIINAKKFSYELVIKEHHLDTLGHVNNATYLQILEEARWEVITPHGYGVEDIPKKGVSPVVLEIQIKYLYELKLRDKITIETQCIDVKSKICQLENTILNKENKVCCKAIIYIGMLDMKERRLLPLTPEWLIACGVTI